MRASTPRRITRRGLYAATAALAAPLAAACGGTAGSGTVPAAAPAAPATLSVWFNANPLALGVQAYAQTVGEFQEKNPSVKVTAEPLPGTNTTEQEEKILTSAAGGTLPDLSYVHPVSNATFALRGVTLPLEPFLNKSRSAFDLKDFYAGAIDYFRWDGKLWALPTYSGPNIFYYNKSLLQQAGLPDPWEQYQKGEWTLQRYDDAVQRLTRGQGESKVFGTREINRSVRNQSPWIQGFGGEVWNARATETLLNGDGAVRAWEYLTGQVLRGLAPGPDDLRGVSGGNQTVFVTGRLGFYDGIRSEVTGFKDVPFGVVPKHKMADGKEYNRDGPNGMTLTKGTRAPDAAWQFLTFNVTRGVEVGMSLGLTAPTTRTLARSPAWLNQLVTGEQPKAYDAAAVQVKAILLPPRLSEIDKLIQDAYVRVLSGQASARQAMTEIKPQVDAILGASGR
ncbi:MAG TPA: sugar ABC transporter substrate-binding protein [Chloroflexota bacterium]|nr:sugar ABC transporter substrate-binding protein [Chloroflexota bacterium]